MLIRKKNGFSILAVILVIVAVIVAIGVWAMSGSSNNTDSSGSAKTTASSILNDSGSIKLAFDTILINNGGKGAIANVVYTPQLSSAYNILDPNNGVPLLSQGKALIDGVSMTNYVYDKNALIGGAGSNSRHEAVVLLAGVKDSVCKEINNQVNGVVITDSIPVFGPINDYNAFIAGASVSNPNTTTQIDFTQSGGTSSLNWGVAGCIRGSNSYDGNNVFYRVLATDID